MTHRIESSNFGAVKMDWSGLAYRWVCDECERKGYWTSEEEAEKSGKQHDESKHGTSTS